MFGDDLRLPIYVRWPVEEWYHHPVQSMLSSCKEPFTSLHGNKSESEGASIMTLQCMESKIYIKMTECGFMMVILALYPDPNTSQQWVDYITTTFGIDFDN